MIDITIAVALDWIIGDPYWFPHPVIYIGKLISFLDKSFRKLSRTKESLRVFGGVIVLIVACISFFVPFFILYFVRNISWLYHILNVLIIWTTIAAKCLHKEGYKVYEALRSGNIEDARLKLSYIVGRDTNELSEQEIVRADVETVAENTSDGIIAPLLFAMVFGAPGAMLYKGINTMDSMLGYMNEKYRYIGFFPAKTDDVFNFLPARITGILMCFTAPIVRGNVLESFRVMIRDRRNHKSPNCGYPEAAAAGAMGIQIGGINRYFGELMYKPTIGDRKAELCKEHIVDTFKLMYSAEILFLIIYLAIMRCVL